MNKEGEKLPLKVQEVEEGVTALSFVPQIAGTQSIFVSFNGFQVPCKFC